MFKTLLTTGLLSLLACFAMAEDPKYVEGTHYTRIATPFKTSFRDAEIGEITEFFSYNCIHCFNFEPALDRFKSVKPDNIRFTAVPVMFNERQAPEVRAYYVLEVLQLKDEAHQKIFNAIHNERRSLRTDSAFAKFFEANLGVTAEEYMKQAYSFGVNAKVNGSVMLTGGSGIGGTPSIAVNGKYLINSRAVGGNEAALYVAQWLVENDPS